MNGGAIAALGFLAVGAGAVYVAADRDGRVSRALRGGATPMRDNPSAGRSGKSSKGARRRAPTKPPPVPRLRAPV